MAWAASDTGALLRVHAAVDCDWIRVHFLSADGSAEVVYCVPVLFGAGRGEFRDVYAVAAGAVSDGVPRERVCVCDFGGEICGSGIYIFGGGGRCAFPYDWETCGVYRYRVWGWIIVAAVWA